MEGSDGKGGKEPARSKQFPQNKRHPDFSGWRLLFEAPGYVRRQNIYRKPAGGLERLLRSSPLEGNNNPPARKLTASEWLQYHVRRNPVGLCGSDGMMRPEKLPFPFPVSELRPSDPPVISPDGFKFKVRCPKKPIGLPDKIKLDGVTCNWTSSPGH